MIDPELLRQLGWAEDLIAEVVRVGSGLGAEADRVVDPTKRQDQPTAVSGSSLNLLGIHLGSTSEIRWPF